MTNTMTTKRPRKKKKTYQFPDELIDQVLAQVEDKNAKSILVESSLVGGLGLGQLADLFRSVTAPDQSGLFKPFDHLVQ